MNQSPTPPTALDVAALRYIHSEGHTPVVMRVALAVEYVTEDGEYHAFVASNPDTDAMDLLRSLASGHLAGAS